MLSFYLPQSWLCTSVGVLRSLHKLKSAGDTWALIDRCYPSWGENGALGRVKAAFSWQCNIYPKRLKKKKKKRRRLEEKKQQFLTRTSLKLHRAYFVNKTEEFLMLKTVSATWEGCIIFKTLHPHLEFAYSGQRERQRKKMAENSLSHMWNLANWGI